MGRRRREFDDDSDYERRDGKRLDKAARNLLRQARRPSFNCIQCKNEVPTDATSTKHRNHCPICLWSRHVDVAIGDRRSHCQSAMEPIGLTIKRDGGELMIVHRCVGCGTIGKNRIAGDDNHASITNLLIKSSELGVEVIEKLHKLGIELCDDAELVEERLHGRRE